MLSAYNTFIYIQYLNPENYYSDADAHQESPTVEFILNTRYKENVALDCFQIHPGFLIRYTSREIIIYII